MSEIIFAVIGVFTGFIAGLFGIGGGTIIVPIMLYLHSPSMHAAIGISIFQMIFSSIFGTLLNLKKKNLNIKEGLVVGFGGLFGASFSGLIHSLFSDFMLGVLFLCFSIYALYKFTFKIKTNIGQIESNKLKTNLILFTAGSITGVFAISLGIGGGLLMTPILAYYLGYESKKVVPLSLFFVIFASCSGAISLYNAGVIDSSLIKVGSIIGIFSIIGVIFGTNFKDKISNKNHRILLIIIYLFSIIATIYNLITKEFSNYL